MHMLNTYPNSDQFDVRLVYVAGDKSSAGKTSTCMAILDTLITAHGFQPEQLGYIKPCSQCVDVQLIWKYCHRHGILFRGLGPVLFYAGFTEECLLHGDDPQSEFYPESLRAKIVSAVQQMIDNLLERNESNLNPPDSTQKRALLIVVDGVGHPAVSSLCGVSNGQVAQCLGIPVVQVVRPCERYSLGATLDSFELYRRFLESYDGTRVAGVIFNKMKIPHADEEEKQVEKEKKRHRLERLIRTFFEKRERTVHLYGIVDEVKLAHIPSTDSKDICVAPKHASSEALNKARFQVTQEDLQTIEQLVNNFRASIPNLDAILDAIDSFFTKERQHQHQHR